MTCPSTSCTALPSTATITAYFESRVASSATVGRALLAAIRKRFGLKEGEEAKVFEPMDLFARVQAEGFKKSTEGMLFSVLRGIVRLGQQRGDYSIERHDALQRSLANPALTRRSPYATRPRRLTAPSPPKALPAAPSPIPGYALTRVTDLPSLPERPVPSIGGEMGLFLAPHAMIVVTERPFSGVAAAGALGEHADHLPERPFDAVRFLIARGLRRAALSQTG